MSDGGMILTELLNRFYGAGVTVRLVGGNVDLLVPEGGQVDQYLIDWVAKPYLRDKLVRHLELEQAEERGERPPALAVSVAPGRLYRMSGTADYAGM